MTKGPISREDLTILDVHVPNKRWKTSETKPGSTIRQNMKTHD